jgi:hypothetical protein
MIHTTQETDDDVKQAYLLLLQAKKQIESDEKEIERLKKQYTDHLELDADESMEFQAKYNMRVSERNAALRYRDELQSELDAQRERNMFSEQQLVKMIAELKAVDMGDSETRIRIYHVLNKYNML